MRTTVEVDIDAPSATAFDLMADIRNEPTWNSKVTEVELLSGEPLAQGSRFRSVNRGQEYGAVLAEHAPPGRLAFEVTGKPMTILAHLDFAERGGATHLVAEFDLRPNGFMKVMLPLMWPLIRRDFPKQLGSFKAFCESRVGTAGPAGDG